MARLRHNAAETEKWLQRAVEVAPESADVLRAWGRHQFTQRNFTLSEIALKKAAALDPDSAPTQLDLGNLYLNWLHRPSDAAAVYRQAIKLQPDHGGALSAWPWACPDIYPLIYPKRTNSLTRVTLAGAVDLRGSNLALCAIAGRSRSPPD